MLESFGGERGKRVTQNEVTFEYQYFDSKHERNDIYEFCKELATYLYRENIENIFFLDRSARPAWIGVDEYWNQNFSDTKKPGFYFINPSGIKVPSLGPVTDPQEIKSILSEFFTTGQVSLPRLRQGISDRFVNVYSQLMEDREKPIVVFDTCAHTGETMLPVLDLLGKVGFTDVRVVTANEPDEDSGLVPATYIDINTRLTSCYPFGHGSLVRKTDDVLSERNTNPMDEFFGRVVRAEIRQIMKRNSV